MLKLKKLKKDIQNKTLFHDVDLTINSGTKAALIGPNGCGKSTMLKIIQNIEPSDGGQVIIDRETIGYLPQELNFEDGQTTSKFITSLSQENIPEWIIHKTLDQMGLRNFPPKIYMNDLSEGQKMKFKLTQILIHQPTLLLLDEPTNHLDINGIRWFEKLVNSISGSILMISHDRSFLDNTVNLVLEFDEQTVHAFHGNYSDYKEQKVQWVAKRDQEYKAQERKRKQIDKLLANARKITDGKKRGKAVRAAKKRMEREVLRTETNEYQEYGMSKLNLSGSTHSSKLILSASEVSKKYGDTLVLNDLSFEVRGKERIWLYGENGAGKTTLVKIITDNLAPSSGTVKVGESVKFGYFQQNQQHLPKESTLREYIGKELHLLDNDIYKVLSKLQFEPSDIDKKLHKLSPGQRARLSFGIFTHGEYDFLILDEPTNHLDIWTKEVIEESLSQFQGTILLVSHDRYFVENVGVDKVLNLDQGRLTLV